MSILLPPSFKGNIPVLAGWCWCNGESLKNVQSICCTEHGLC